MGLAVRAGLFDRSERYRCLSTRAGGEPRDLDREHRAIVEAALRRDAPTAEALLARHLALTAELTNATLALAGDMAGP